MGVPKTKCDVQSIQEFNGQLISRRRSTQGRPVMLPRIESTSLRKEGNKG